MYSIFHLFALFYALRSFVIVFTYVLVFHCIYFPLTFVLNTELLQYYIILSPILYHFDQVFTILKNFVSEKADKFSFELRRILKRAVFSAVTRD